MDEIEKGHPERQLRTAHWLDPATLTIPSYHTQDGNQTDFRLNRSADAADRSHFPRLDLPAVPEDDSTESTNPSGSYDKHVVKSTKSKSTSQALTRRSWSTIEDGWPSPTVAGLARRLLTLFANDPASATRLGASTDLAADLVCLFAPGAGHVRPSRLRETLSKALELGVVEQSNGRLIVHANDAVIDGYPTAQTSISNMVFAKVVLRDGLVCQLCFSAVTESFDLDHIVPVADGGLDTVENLRVTHTKCNRSRAKEVRMSRYGTYGVKRTPKGAS